MTTTTEMLVLDAAATIVALTPGEVAEARCHDDVVLVDVREADERVETGSIPGARHIPRGVLELCADRLDPARRIIVYCDDGTRSALAGATLRTLGYPDVAHLRGGILAWTASGLPTTGRRPLPY